MTETQEKVERELEEVLEKFDFDELSEEEKIARNVRKLRSVFW